VDLLEKKGKKEEEIIHIKKCISHVNKHAEILETTFAKASLEFLITKKEESHVEKEEGHGHSNGEIKEIGHAHGNSEETNNSNGEKDNGHSHSHD